MWGKFLYYILQFQGLIFLTMVSLIVLTLAVLLLMKDFSWNRRRRLMVMTLFFHMPGQYMVYLAANYIQLMFVWSSLLFSVHMELSHLIFLVLLGLIQAVSIAQIGEGIRSFFGSVLLYAAFLIVDLLKSYIFDMRFDWRIAFVCCLLSVFFTIIFRVFLHQQHPLPGFQGSGADRESEEADSPYPEEKSGRRSGNGGSGSGGTGRCGLDGRRRSYE